MVFSAWWTSRSQSSRLSTGPVLVHSEYALLAHVVIASDTAVFSDVPHLAFGIAPGDGLFVVWEEVLGLNRARFLELTSGSFTAQDALAGGLSVRWYLNKKSSPGRKDWRSR